MVIAVTAPDDIWTSVTDQKVILRAAVKLLDPEGVAQDQSQPAVHGLQGGEIQIDRNSNRGRGREVEAISIVLGCRICSFANFVLAERVVGVEYVDVAATSTD